MSAKGHKDCRQRGALFVEAALVIPFFIYLVMNMIYFGLLLHDYMDLNNITRSAVRYAVVEASGENITDKTTSVKAFLKKENFEDRMFLYKLQTSAISNAAPPNRLEGPGGFVYSSEEGDYITVVLAAKRDDAELPLLVDAVIPQVISSSLAMKLEQ